MGKRDRWYVPGYKVVTEQIVGTLEYLISQDDEYGGAWCNLDHVHHNTLQSLLRRDWIQRSPRPDGSGDDYKITTRGRKAAKECRAHTTRDYRRDGICSRCGERPRSRKNGGYCKPCNQEVTQARRSAHPKYHTRHEGKTCTKCKKRPIRHHKLCNACNYQRGKAQKMRQAAEIEAGIRPAPICPTCNERPRGISNGILLGYCYECNRQKYRDINKQKYARRMQEKIDRLFGKR